MLVFGQPAQRSPFENARSTLAPTPPIEFPSSQRRPNCPDRRFDAADLATDYDCFMTRRKNGTKV